ncbi:MAG: fasciclin domain-containing protein [Bacteroidota bacterium]
MITVNKPRNFFVAVALGAFLTTSFTACDKDDNDMAGPQSIADIVNTNASFSLLKAAVAKAELGAALSSGSLTVFAPDDAAFAASGITSATIGSLTKEQLADILTYHVVGAEVPSSSVPASDTVKTLQGRNIYASKNSNGVFVNGSAVKTADVDASNGVIHVISSVLMPPTKTIAQLAAETPALSVLYAAVAKAGLAGAVSGAGKYTVFAPTNTALAAAGFPTPESINAADAAAVAGIVTAHVLPTNVFSSDLINAATAATIKPGTSLTVGTTPPSVKISTSAATPSNIVVPAGVNIIATNGVIHLIDKVLL